LAIALPVLAIRGATCCWSRTPQPDADSGIWIAQIRSMLKLLGSYALAKLLGFGIFGAIVIYAVISMLS
jgi:hypothetical protein